MFLTAVVLLSSFAWSGVPATRPSSAHPVAQTLLDFLDALESADAAALGRLIWVADASRAQESGRSALIELIAAHRRLELAAASRFPAQSGRIRRSFDLLCAARERAVISQSVPSFDDLGVARIVLPGEVRPVRFRRSTAGQWQVVIDIIDSDLDDAHATPFSLGSRIAQLRVERLAAMAAAVNAVAARIEAGDYREIAAAELDLIDRMGTIRTEYRRNVDETMGRQRFRPPRQPFQRLPD